MGGLLPSRQNAGLPFQLMAQAEGLGQVSDFRVKAFLQKRGMNNFPAHLTAHKLVGDDLVPAVLQHVLELNGMLRADSPAGGAAGAAGHIVKKRLHPPRLRGIQRPRRAVLNTGQTPVALFVHLKIDHLSFPSSSRGSNSLEIASAACFVFIAISAICPSFMLCVNPTTQIADIGLPGA
jgi:hypothetical protein